MLGQRTGPRAMQCRLEPVCTSWPGSSGSFPAMVHKGSISTSWKQSGTMCQSFSATITADPVFLPRMRSSTVHHTVLSRNRVQRGFVLLGLTVPCETGVLVWVHLLLIGWSNGIYVLHPCCLNVQRARKISNRLPEVVVSILQIESAVPLIPNGYAECHKQSPSAVHCCTEWDKIKLSDLSGCTSLPLEFQWKYFLAKDFVSGLERTYLWPNSEPQICSFLSFKSKNHSVYMPLWQSSTMKNIENTSFPKFCKEDHGGDDCLWRGQSTDETNLLSPSRLPPLTPLQKSRCWAIVSAFPNHHQVTLLNVLSLMKQDERHEPTKTVYGAWEYCTARRGLWGIPRKRKEPLWNRLWGRESMTVIQVATHILFSFLLTLPVSHNKTIKCL